MHTIGGAGCRVAAAATLAFVLCSGDLLHAQCEPSESAKLHSLDSANHDQFGRSVALSGDVALISASGHIHDENVGSGAVYVARFDGSTWNVETELLASDGEVGDVFGFAIALEGDVLVVSATHDDDGAENAGSAYVFRFTGSAWVEEAKLHASSPVPTELFGWSVALSGDAIIVGTRHDVNSPLPGAAYVFRYDGSRWNEEAMIVPPDAEPGQAVGWSVAIAGDTALVASPGEDELTGSVFVSHFDGTTWVPSDKLLASDGAEGDQFGIAVAFDGEAALIGANFDDDNGSFSGSAYVFRFNGATWIEEAKLLAWDGAFGDQFGRPVLIRGDIALVGSPSSDPNGLLSGSAYLYRREGGTWAPAAKLMPAGSGDQFPSAVALDGNRIVAGTMLDNVNHINNGSVYFFEGVGDCNVNGELDLCDVVDGTSPDLNDNGIPDECECPWDLDGDGNVFVTDLLLLLMDFGSCEGSPADFDGDGCVTVLDLLTLLGNWGPCPGSPCIWDVNGDGTVDQTDLRLVLGNFGPCNGCPEDVNGDGVVNGQDAAAVATHFGPCP